LAAVAREISQIRLGTDVTQIPFRNPALLARQALTLHHTSRGRLDLGLGVGLRIDPAYDMMGLKNWTDKERTLRLPEYVEVTDRLLSSEVSI
jgi:alkanesulfonate monooxygenase SsuD/methylene tetrahydromethanopterin reductase-like flavin-dependent oxidoreductase (luciferase family)